MKLVIASVISLLSFSALAAPEGTLSVHILNQQTGLPSPGCRLSWISSKESWQHIATGKTDADGRIKSLYPQAENMEPGVYKVTFKTGDYFKSQNMNTFFPVVPVIFNVTKQNQNCISRCCSVSTDTLPTAAADNSSRYPANACASPAGVTLSCTTTPTPNAWSLSL